MRGLSSSSCRGLLPLAEASFALQAKKELILGNFWCSVVASVTFSSNFENIKKKIQTLPIISKNPKKNPKKSEQLQQKNHQNPYKTKKMKSSKN